MPNFRVEHDKPNCISCGACATVADKFWEMETTGECKSHLKDSELHDSKKEWETLEIQKEDLDMNKNAAEVCPVNVIHIKDEKGNKLI